MGNSCNTNQQLADEYKSTNIESIQMSDNFDELNILDYETRLKMFASPQNKGFINKVQLMEAFK